MNRFRNFLPLVVAAAALFGMASSADAGFQVTFKVDAASATIVDGGAGDDDGVVNGEISVNSKTVGAYTFKVNLSESNTPNVGGTIAFINHGTNNITGTGAAKIQIIASANDFADPVGPLYAMSGSTFQFLAPTPAGHLADHSYSAYLDNSNKLATSVPAGTLIGSKGPVTVSSSTMGNSSLSDTRTVTAAAPYALTLQLQADIKSGGANKIDLDGGVQVTSVPAPAGVVLLLTGVPVLGLGAWFRRRRILPRA